MSSPMRTRRAHAQTSGRFGRRTATPSRHAMAGGWLQRSRPEPQSGLKRALSAFPGRSMSRSRPSSRGRRGAAGGLALLAGAAGLAVGMARRRNRSSSTP